MLILGLCRFGLRILKLGDISGSNALIKNVTGSKLSRPSTVRIINPSPTSSRTNSEMAKACTVGSLANSGAKSSPVIFRRRQNVVRAHRTAEKVLRQNGKNLRFRDVEVARGKDVFRRGMLLKKHR